MSTSDLKIVPIVYTPKEYKHYGALVRRLCEMRNERDRVHQELDGMTYLEYYDNNRRKDLAYIPPKNNRNDIRLSSGVTREKDTSLVSTILNLDLVPDIKAFDKDNHFINELGENMGDLVKKSRELEDWDLYRSKIYRELFAQGDVFIQEQRHKQSMVSGLVGRMCLQLSTLSRTLRVTEQHTRVGTL
jgi:hypothetical protein